MLDRARQSDAMILIAYAIRADAVESEYEDWLRRVDCPFFNAAPGVAQYVNWKVAAGRNVFAPRPYFDFLVMHGIESFDAVWLDPELNAFRRQWRELWGETAVQEGAHAPTFLCQRVARTEMSWSPHVAFVPCDADDRLAGFDTWHVERPLRGPPSPPFAAFHVRYLSGTDEFARLAIAADAALLGRCIAAP
jgi:hypothetical protein